MGLLNLGNIVVHLPKKNNGEFFEGLGLLTKLLSSKGANSTGIASADTKSTNSADLSKPNYKPLVEVLDGIIKLLCCVALSVVLLPDDDSQGACACVDNGDEDDDFDWSIEQALPKEETSVSSLLNNKVLYGFANQYSGVLSKLQVSTIKHLRVEFIFIS